MVPFYVLTREEPYVSDFIPDDTVKYACSTKYFNVYEVKGAEKRTFINAWFKKEHLERLYAFCKQKKTDLVIGDTPDSILCTIRIGEDAVYRQMLSIKEMNSIIGWDYPEFTFKKDTFIPIFVKKIDEAIQSKNTNFKDSEKELFEWLTKAYPIVYEELQKKEVNWEAVSYFIRELVFEEIFPRDWVFLKIVVGDIKVAFFDPEKDTKEIISRRNKRVDVSQFLQKK